MLLLRPIRMPRLKLLSPPRPMAISTPRPKATNTPRPKAHNPRRNEAISMPLPRGTAQARAILTADNTDSKINTQWAQMAQEATTSGAS